MPVSQLSFTSRSRRTRSRASRHARRVLALLFVAVLAFPAMLAVDRVAIDVDGQTQHVRAYGGTVDQVLAAAGIEVGPDDMVQPAPGVLVRDGLEVEVVRAVPVTLEFRDHVRWLPVAGDTVEDVLVAAGFGSVEGLSIEPGPNTPLAEVDHVVVHQPVTVRIRADGQTSRVRLTAGTVGDALKLARIGVGEDDRVSLPLDRDISDRGAKPVNVTITRVDQERVLEHVTLPFHEDVVYTADRYEDQSAVVQDGIEGERQDTYVVTREDGEVVDRELVDQEVVREPQNRIVEVGTATRPAPEPPRTYSGSDVWDRLAQCEAGGNWSLNTGNGYYGGLQFALGTWRDVGGSGYPHEASREEQISRAEILVDRSGGSYRSHWPRCADKLGLP